MHESASELDLAWKTKERSESDDSNKYSKVPHKRNRFLETSPLFVFKFGQL